ncbi:hypothetical protein C9374_005780 [Naegleria lovaniensis]|uniref:EGF-like domain-containing protein n=1 Tax=Naegleria lovaniensis TaxID=51637 RepID=A0AA88GPV9_NAELO|nr:uncharacterized protein C9374_005780 [Naegleria lovaniensis]KAG2381988.1 hypothetical protein C9374_005780 [Naegleria lovaniensis]
MAKMRVTSNYTTRIIFTLLFCCVLIIHATCHGAIANFKSTSATPSLNRKVYGFGSNANGQLSQKDYSSPALVDSLKSATVSLQCIQQFDDGSSSGVRVFMVVSGGGVSGGDALYGFGSSNGVNYLLGLNSTQSFNTPQLIGSYSSSIRSLACGVEHVLFVLNNAARDVYGFGNNNYEQLGYGFSSLSVPTLLPISTLQSINVDKVFAVHYSSFATEETSNNLYGWGDNTFGMMGFVGSQIIISNATLLSGSQTGNKYTGVKKVVGYGRSLFVLTTSGQVFASGSNDQGVLGVNSNTFQIATPTPLAGISATVLDISIYRQGAMATTNDGSVYYWGNNDMNALCTTQSPTSSILPVKINSDQFSPALTQNIAQISLSYQHAMLLAQDQRTIYVCGDNTEGQLGMGTSPFVSTVNGAKFSNSTTPAGKSVSSILTAATKNSFVLTTDGKLYTMGTISGSGDTVYYTSPSLLQNIPSGIQLEHVYTSAGFVFATEHETGKTWAWGKNRSPYNFINPNIAIDQFTPRMIPELSEVNVTSISIGYGVVSSTTHSTVLFLSNDTLSLYAMGSNAYGQFGNNNKTTNIQLIPTRNQYENGSVIIDSVNCGAIHTVMRAKRKSYTVDQYDLFVMGGNSRGQIGLFNFDDIRATPLRTSQQNIKQVTAGEFHTITVNIETRGGGGSGVKTYITKPYAAGDNSNGQIGLNALQQVSSFREVGNLEQTSNGVFYNITDITAVYTGGKSTFILTANGTFVTGDNTYGQLGFNPSVNGTKFIVPVLNSNLPSNIIKVAISRPTGGHVAILTSTGAVYVMGQNDKGQLGLGHTNNVYTPTLLTVPNNEAVIDVSTGDDFTLIITGNKPCPGDCNYKGVCNYVTGFCSCASGFTGYDCNLFDCVDPKCNGHGTCDTSIGICKCDSAYSGISCERRKCPNDCNGNGLCNTKDGVCTCFAGFTSKVDCSTPDRAGMSVFDWRSFVTLIVIALSVVILVVKRM